MESSSGQMVMELCTAHINQWWKLYKVQRMKRVEDFEREKRKRIYRGGGRKERAKGKDLKRSRAKTKASSKPLKRKRSESNGSGSRKIPKKEAASISQYKAIFLTDQSTTVETGSFQFRNEEAAAIQLTTV